MRAFFAWLDHFFLCKWEVRNVQTMLAAPSPVHGAIWGYSTEDVKPEPVTQVLQVCKVCGRLRTETLHGNWTMNDLVGGLPNATA